MLSYCTSIRFCNLCQHSSWKREWSIIILVGIFIAPWIRNIWQQQRAVQSDSHQLILQFTFPVFVILLDMDIILITLANESWFNFVFGILEQSIDLSERHSQVWCVWSYIYPMFVAEMSTRQWVLSSITNWTCLCSGQAATARCLLPLPATWMSFFQQYLD